MAQGLSDALSIPATVLPNGPSALEVGQKRMGLELEREKMGLQKKIADDKIKEKQKEAAAKDFKIDVGTVFQPHTADYLNQRYARMDYLANADSRFKSDKSGKFGNPYDNMDVRPGGGGSRENQGNLVELEQFKSNSNQMKDDYNVMTKLVSADPTKWKPGTMEELVTYYSDPQNARTGKLHDPLVGLYDTDKDLKEAFGAIEADQTAWANTAGTASGTNEFTVPEDIKAVAEEKGAHPYIKLDLEERFAGLPEERQAQIAADAKRNNMTVAGMMALNVGTAEKLYSRKTAISEQQSEGGAGAKKREAGLNWLAEVTKSVVEGSFKGDQGNLPAIGSGALGGVTPLGGIPVAKGGKSPEENLKVFDGWTLQKQKAYVDVDGTMKLADNNVVVDNVKYDRPKGEWVLQTTTTGTNEKRTLRFSNEKWESDVYPTLIGENEDKIDGIGGYVNTEQVSPNFDAKNAQNMAGAQQQKKSAYSTTQPSGGKKKAY